MAMSPRGSRALQAAAALLAVALAAALWMVVRAPSVGMAWVVAGALAAAALLLVISRTPTAPSQDQPDASAVLRAELDEARRRLQQFDQIADIGQWRWWPEDDSLWWSPQLGALYGVSAAAAPATLAQMLAFVHPDDRTRLREFFAGLGQGGQGDELQFRIRRPDMGVRCVAIRGGREASADGCSVVHGVQTDVTALTNARRRLQLAEAQYRFLFEHTPMSMWVFDRESMQLLAVNEQTVAQYGFDHDGSHPAPSLTMLDFDAAREQPVRPQVPVRGDDDRQGAVWTYRRADGSVQQAAVFSQDIDFDGRPARLVAAQGLADKARSQTLLQLVARATSDAIYDWDIGRNALWISDSFFTTFGYERSTFLPTIGSWRTRIHADDAGRVTTSLAEAVKGNAETWRGEYSFRRGDGEYANVVHRGLFLRDADGRALRMVGGFLDVTERRRDAADLRLLRRAVASANTGFMISKAPDGGQPIVYVNAGFEAITGYSSDEAIGRNMDFLQGDARDQPAAVHVHDAVAAGHEARVVLKSYRKSGELFWAELHLSPLRDEAGRLSHFMTVVTDVTERHRFEEQLAHRATHDDLTGIPNRQLVIDRLQHAIHAAVRRQASVTVLFIDLDNFKLINDTLGHAAGDAVLRIVAERLAGLVRGADTAGRLGGDEFVLILEEPEGEADMARLIARISDVLSAPMEIEDATTALTTSIGYCSFPRDAASADAMLVHADIAMFEAKRRGRNQAVAYRAEFDVRESSRKQLVAQLGDALRRQEFSLVFQPMFLPSGKPAAIEALVRWNHPEHGELQPDHFIGACEQHGLIVELDRFVFAAAAGYHQQLVAAGLGHIRIAVNVSSVHLTQDLYGDIERVVRERELPGGALEMELTESVLMDNPEKAIDTMSRLARLGVSSTVDDFGTGYSSLSYLKRLPIARIKIDRSFVHDLRSDVGDRSICASIISLARSMDLRTVAEGVETQFQLDWLRDHGVDEFQGFLLGRPAPFEQVLGRLAGR